MVILCDIKFYCVLEIIFVHCGQKIVDGRTNNWYVLGSNPILIFFPITAFWNSSKQNVIQKNIVLLRVYSHWAVAFTFTIHILWCLLLLNVQSTIKMQGTIQMQLQMLSVNGHLGFIHTEQLWLRLRYCQNVPSICHTICIKHWLTSH